MSRLEIKVDGKDVDGAKMLLVATNTLKVLKSIERQIARERGEKPSIRWRIDMMSGHSYGLIAIRGEARSPKDEDKARLQMTADEAIRRLKAEQDDG